MTVINWYKYFSLAFSSLYVANGPHWRNKKGVEKWLKWWDFSHHINPILMTVPTLPNQFYVDILLVFALLLVFFGFVEGIGGDFLGVTRGLCCCCLRIFRVEKVMLLCMTNLWRRWWSWRLKCWKGPWSTEQKNGSKFTRHKPHTPCRTEVYKFSLTKRSHHKSDFNLDSLQMMITQYQVGARH